MRSPQNRISLEEWSHAGLDHLLVDPSPHELEQMLVESGDQLSDLLMRGMLSTAKIGILEFRNLAEAIAGVTSVAEAYRSRGREIALARPVPEAVAWSASIVDPTSRAYAILGITDTLFPVAH